MHGQVTDDMGDSGYGGRNQCPSLDPPLGVLPFCNFMNYHIDIFPKLQLLHLINQIGR